MTEDNVKILPDKTMTKRITSEDARAFKPKNLVVIDMQVLDPPEPIGDDAIAAKRAAELTPSNETLKLLADRYPAPTDWYEEP